MSKYIHYSGIGGKSLGYKHQLRKKTIIIIKNSNFSDLKFSTHLPYNLVEHSIFGQFLFKVVRKQLIPCDVQQKVGVSSAVKSSTRIRIRWRMTPTCDVKSTSNQSLLAHRHVLVNFNWKQLYYRVKNMKLLFAFLSTSISRWTMASVWNQQAWASQTNGSVDYLGANAN